MKTMVVINGKFYKNGLQVPIEHGNTEQINIIERINNYMTEGEYPEISETRLIKLYVDCTCGTEFIFKDLELEDDEFLDTLAGRKQKCTHCNNHFKLECDENGELIVKLIENTKRKRK